MRHNGARYIPDPAKFVGKWVHTTSNDVWRVEDAYVKGGVVVLIGDPAESQITDHEHATLLPFKYQGPGVEGVRNPLTRETEWNDEE